MAKTYFPYGYWPDRILPGWHWPNMSHGHRVYCGIGSLSNVDFGAPVAVAQADSGTIALVGLGHAASTRYTYAVRPVAANGWLETPDTSCTVEFETDSAGQWPGGRPAPVEWLTVAVQQGGQITLSWLWRRPQTGTEPDDFGLYCSTSPDIEAGCPSATEPFVSGGEYSHTFCLENGRSYWFAVTTRDSGGCESYLSNVIGPFVADTVAPSDPTVNVFTRF